MGSLRKKLNLKQQQLVIVKLPSELEPVFRREGDWTKYDEMPEGQAEAVLAFAKTQEELQTLIPEVMAQVTPDTILWFAYPKKNSKRYDSDISRDKGWERLEKFHYKPLRQIALDEDWSALRFRRKLSQAEG